MTSLSETSIIAGAAGAGDTGYTIDQSIRFNDGDSPSLDKTYSGAGSRTTFTISVWFKLGAYFSGSGAMPFFNGGTVGSDTGWGGVGVRYDGSGAALSFQGYSTNYRITTRKFRDHSAWYHAVFVWDTTNSISSERVRIYVNGLQETDFSSSSDPSASAQSGIGQAAKHSIGYQSRSVGFNYFDGYIAEMHFLDGYAYGPENFGEFKENTDIWIPKEYEGSYGTNGFYIDGRDSSDLGDDESGQGNDYTASGLAANDQRADSPTNNHVTFNPVAVYIDGAAHTFANGNLDVSNASGAWGSAQTGLGIPGSGKWTFAFKLTNSISGTQYPIFGIIDSLNQPNTHGIALPYQSGTPANSMVYVNTYQDASQAYFFKGGGGSESTIGSAFNHGGATNGEWQWFVNSDDKELTVYHNGTVRLDAYDISFLTFPVFIAATLYDYDDLRLLNLPSTEYTPSISGYKAINTRNIGL